MKYAFSEHQQPKGFRVLDLEQDKSTFIPFNLLRDLHVFEGTFEDVINGRVEELLNIETERDAFYQFVLEGLEGVPEPMSRIQNVYPNALELKRKSMNVSDVEHKTLGTLSSDHNVFEQFMENYLDDALQEEAKKVFNTYFKEGQNETD